MEEERKFLLRSLVDLEREHDAGDVDDVDYQELKDGYTVRAAHTLRAIEAGRAAVVAQASRQLEASVGRGGRRRWSLWGCVVGAD